MILKLIKKVSARWHFKTESFLGFLRRLQKMWAAGPQLAHSWPFLSDGERAVSRGREAALDAGSLWLQWPLMENNRHS